MQGHILHASQSRLLSARAFLHFMRFLFVIRPRRVDIGIFHKCEITNFIFSDMFVRFIFSINLSLFEYDNHKFAA